VTKKYRIPKKIAGIKVPKALRRGLRDMAANQNRRVILTEALVAAGAAVAAARTPPGPKIRRIDPKARPNVDGAERARDKAPAGTVGMAALEDAARAFTSTLRQRGVAEAPPTPDPGATGPAGGLGVGATH